MPSSSVLCVPPVPATSVRFTSMAIRSMPLASFAVITLFLIKSESGTSGGRRRPATGRVAGTVPEPRPLRSRRRPSTLPSRPWRRAGGCDECYGGWFTAGCWHVAELAFVLFCRCVSSSAAGAARRSVCNGAPEPAYDRCGGLNPGGDGARPATGGRQCAAVDSKTTL